MTDQVAARVVGQRLQAASTLGLAPSRVSVKFKAAEKVGPVGEGRSGEAQAVVTLRRD